MKYESFLCLVDPSKLLPTPSISNPLVCHDTRGSAADALILDSSSSLMVQLSQSYIATGYTSVLKSRILLTSKILRLVGLELKKMHRKVLCLNKSTSLPDVSSLINGRNVSRPISQAVQAKNSLTQFDVTCDVDQQVSTRLKCEHGAHRWGLVWI